MLNSLSKKVGRQEWELTKKNDNGVMNWYEENGTYYISGDVVTITDNNGEDDNVVFDTRSKYLCIQGTGVTENGIPYKVTAYLKK